jgi:YD repeat-containing protein
MKAIAPLVPASCCLAVLRRPLSGFACAARTALCAITALAVSAISVSACGMSWSRPSSPTDSDFRFQYYEELGRVGLEKTNRKEDTTIPLHLGFNPAFRFPSLLGVGWSLPIFESRIEWLNSDTALLRLPDGLTSSLERMRENKQRLEGDGWIAEIFGRQVTCKASCGWTLIFRDNRLVSMITPNGTQMELVTATDRSRNWVVNGHILISIKPDFDKKTTQKIYYLKYGNKNIRLNIGSRPAAVSKKTSKGMQIEKLTQVESLVSVEKDATAGKKYSFRQNEMLADRHLYRWDKKTYFLEQDGNNKFSHVKINEVQCLKAEFNGDTFVEGENEDKRISQYNGGEIVVTDKFYLKGFSYKAFPRRISTFGADGKEHLVQQFWYDENGQIFKTMDNSDGTEKILMRRDNEETLKNNKTGEQIWRKVYDKKGRIVAFHLPTVSYSFAYPKDETLVRMTRTDKDTTSVVQIPTLRARTLIDELGSPQNNK